MMGVPLALVVIAALAATAAILAEITRTQTKQVYATANTPKRHSKD